jgi:hypothetical protein
VKDLILPAVKHLDVGDRLVAAYELPRPVEVRDMYWHLTKESKTGFFKLRIGNPHKPRSTGKRSQCSRINGHIQWICMVRGLDFDTMKNYLKRKAISGGYPSETDPEGQAVPWSEARISVEQATILCQFIEMWAAEENLPLPEYSEEGDLIYI